MPLNRYVVRVDPQGQSVTVDILDTSGVSVVVYDTSQFAAVPRTLPMVITAQTDFWLHNPGPYDVSCKVGGAEVADAGAPERVQVSDVPVLVVPDWERERTAASSGGSIQVVSKTANYTAANGDAVLADASGGNFTVTLPAPASGAKVTVKNVGATGAVTVAHHAAENIDDGTTYAVNTPMQSRDFLSDGTNWWIV